MTSINILVILGLLSLSSIIKAVPVIYPLINGEQKNYIGPKECLDSLYIMVLTSGIENAQTENAHGVTIEVANDNVRLSLLPELHYEPNKGDMWKLSFKDDFQLDYCVRKYDIRSIAIEENGDDGWNIETIVTFIGSGRDYELATSDFEVNHWIEGDKSASRRRLELTLVF